MVLENLKDLPDQSVLLLQYLQDAGSASQKELIDHLNLPLRSIRYAIRRLKEEQLILSKPDLLDMRSLKYELNTQNSDQIEIVMRYFNETTA